MERRGQTGRWVGMSGIHSQVRVNPPQMHVFATSAQRRRKAGGRRELGDEKHRGKKAERPDGQGRHRETNPEVLRSKTPRLFQYENESTHRQGVFSPP
jgi:hypothetical protein